MKKIAYFFVNILVIAISLFFIKLSNFSILKDFNVGVLASLLAIILLIHVIKFLRFYFILLEEKMTIPNALRLYVKTTFVSILIPFKLGEVFKMYCIAHKTNDYRKGISAVLIEKFFDAIMVLSSFAICVLIGGSPQFSILVAILVIFMLFFVLFYLFFGSTYEYMNRFFMSKSSGKKSLNSLKALERLNNFHKSLQKLLRGRQLTIFILTFLSWALEFVFVSLVQNGLRVEMDFNGFVSYISGAFIGEQGIVVMYYICSCIIVLMSALIISYALKLLSLRGRSSK